MSTQNTRHTRHPHTPSRISTWRPAVRMARRDARRHPLRTGFVVVIIALTVGLISFALTFFPATDFLSADDELHLQLGDNEAVLTYSCAGEVRQAPKYYDGFECDDTQSQPATTKRIQDIVGPQATVIDIPVTEATVSYGGYRSAPVKIAAVNPHVNPNLYRVVDSSSPTAQAIGPGELIFTTDVPNAPRLALGDTLTLSPAHSHSSSKITVDVTGRFISPNIDYKWDFFALINRADFDRLTALPTTDAARETHYIIQGAPVSWQMLKELNSLGYLVISREVLNNPPPASEWAEVANPNVGSQPEDSYPYILAAGAGLAVIILTFVVMPVFTVATQRQTRELAMASVIGADSRQIRTIVLAKAIISTTVGSLLGALIGTGTAAITVIAMARAGTIWLIDAPRIPWLALLGLIIITITIGILTALFPATTVARQDVIAALNQRAASTSQSIGKPWIGVGITAVGLTAFALGASAIIPQLTTPGAVGLIAGIIILTPQILRPAARATRRWPTAARLAVRDAYRHSSRTAAVLAITTLAITLLSGLTMMAASRVTHAHTDRPTRVGIGIGALAINDVAFLHEDTSDDGATIPSPADQVAPTVDHFHELANATLGEPISTGLISAHKIERWMPAPGIKLSLDWLANPACPHPYLTEPPASDTSTSSPESPPASALDCPSVSEVSWSQSGIFPGDITVMAPDTLAHIGFPGAEDAAEALARGEIVANTDQFTAPDGTISIHAIDYPGQQALLEAEVNPQGTDITQIPYLGGHENRWDLSKITARDTYRAPAHRVHWQSLDYQTVITPEILEKLGGIADPSFVAFWSESRPLTSGDADALKAALTADPRMKTNQLVSNPQVSTIPTLATVYPPALYVAIALFVTAITWIGLILARNEQRHDDATLIAVGAPLSIRRRIAGWSAALIIAISTVGGVLGGLVMAIASEYAALRSNLGTTTVAITIPWPVLGVEVSLLALITIAGAVISTRPAQQFTRRRQL